MEDTKIIIVALIIIVASILQIVLFFKVWAMTNDVRELRNSYIVPLNIRFEIKKMLVLGNNERAKELILNAFFDKVKNVVGHSYSDDEDDTVVKNADNKYFENAKNELANNLSKIGLELPEGINKLNSIDDFNNLF